ncbi:MAG: hypothetical protein GPJ14_09575 [Microcystis aeruginosa G11-01]|nr:hypothetical protein [Microcystis aeruginosa G11-01]
MLNNRGVLAFSTPTYTITENGTPITQVVVNRTGGSDTEVSATITVNNGTATADDYNNTPIKVTFAHGDSAPKVITIPIKEDSQFEAVETIQLSLINPTNGVTIGSQNTAIVKIIDNDNFVFTNTDIQPTKLEQLTLPIPTALKQYETLSSELDKAKVKLDTTEEQLTLANDDYSFAKETFAGSLSKQKSLTETLQNLGNKKTALTSSFTQSKTQIEQKLKDIQKNIDNASTRLKAETNAGLKDGIQKEINGYLIQIQEQQNLLSIATTRYNQDLGVIDFQISESNQDLQALTSNIISKQVEELEKKNQALVDVKTAWEANKQAVTVADKALGDFLTDYAFLKTQDYSSKFLQDTVNSLNQKISNLQTNLTSLKNSNGSSSEISALEKAILEKQKIVGEVQDYQKTVLAGEVEFKQELETRKTTSADHLASVKVALGSNNIESYVTLSSQLANQLKGLTTVWVDDLQDNHNLTIKVWNGLQAESQAFDSLTSYIDENLATPYGDYYLNEIQLDEALQIRESTVRRRDALADSVNFVTDALFLAKKQLQEYQNLAKLGQHYSDLTKYEKEFNQLNVVEGKRVIVSQFQQQLPATQDIVQAKTSLNNALDDLLNSLDSSILHDVDLLKANIIQNKSLNDTYLDQAKSYLDQAKSYSDQASVYWERSHKQGPQWVEYIPVERTKRSGLKKVKYWENIPVYHDDPDWVLWDDYTKKSQALQQQSSDTIKLSVNVVQSIADNVEAFIGKSELVLQPKLINAVSDEVTNKTQDLVVQIDLTNDQQEQGLETNLQKYIEQKQDSIIETYQPKLNEIQYNRDNLTGIIKYNPKNGHYYSLTKSTTWTDAQAEAKGLGGDLITINNPDEQQWILNTFGTTGNYWIGLKKNLSNGAWEWTNGEAVNYLNWSPNEPNNYGGTENYGMIIGDQDAGYAQGKWNDYANSSILRGQSIQGIIEIDPSKSDWKKLAKYNSQTGKYYVLSKITSWTEAQAEAQRLGGNLITINNADEQQWILNAFGTKGNYWIGLKKNLSNGTWEWTNGEAVNYLNWSPNEPNNYGGIENYGMIIGDQDVNYAQGKWNDWTNASILRGQGLRGIIEIDANIFDQQTKPIEEQTIANLQTLRLETAYLTLQAQQNPDKVQNYLQEQQKAEKNRNNNIYTISNDWVGGWKLDGTDKHYVGDFDGDGRDDILIQRSNSCW